MRPATSRADPATAVAARRSRLRSPLCAGAAPAPRPPSASCPARRASTSPPPKAATARSDPGRLPPLRADHRRSNFNRSRRRLTDGDLRDLRIELPAGADRKPDRARPVPAGQFNTPRPRPSKRASPARAARTQPDRRRRGPDLLGGGETRTFGLFNLAPPPGLPRCSARSPFGVPIAFTPHDPRSRRRIRPHPRAHEPLPAARHLRLRADDLGHPWSSPQHQRGNCLNEAEPGTFGPAPNCRASPRSARSRHPRPPAGLPDPAHLLRGAARLHRQRQLLAAAGPGHADLASRDAAATR